jgi:tetratricopeptide (TPR) repeat protein
MLKTDASNRPDTETITPLSVPRNNMGIGQERHQRKHRFTIIILMCCVIFVVAAGAWFLHFLSKIPIQSQPVTVKQSIRQPEPKTQTVSPPAAQTAPSPAAQTVSPPAARTVPPPAAPPTPAVNPEKLAQGKQMAEQKLAEFLEAKKNLDNIGATEWGGVSYLEMVEIGGKADSLFIKNEYIAASAEYTRATVIGRQLAEQSAEALQRLLEEGRIALTEGKGDVAQEKFKVALLIDPANQSAQKGLKRSQTIEAVLKLIEAGRQHEKDIALSLARNDYREALKIDPDANEARLALNRVTALIKEQQFRQMMSAGLTALHNNNLALARTSLLKAKSIKPGSREVSEALLQLDQALRLARIDRLRSTAQKAEHSEDWQTALKAYLTALDIDKNLQFAILGKKRAGEQIHLAKRLDFYLSQPRVLESDKQLKNAILLLHEANEATPRGQKLTRHTNELARLVAAAQMPVTITIESDNLTQIAVYKVGKLGRFSQHELKLRPGTYTVVGARDGYQDVRRKIVVKPGQQSLRVTVKCWFKI